MKIALFLNKDLEANIAFNILKPELIQHDVNIYYSESVGRNDSKPEDLQTIEHYERPHFYNVVAENCRKSNATFEFFDESFQSFTIKKCTAVNSVEFIQEMKDFGPDLIISIRFGKIFKDKIIAIPKKGVINLHSAILPDYRGIMGTLHNLKDNKPEYGCTLHYIDSAKIDTGQIIQIAKLPVNKDRSLLWHVVQLYPVGCQMILHAIHQLKDSERLDSFAQDMTEGNYFSVPKTDDFMLLNQIGIKSFNIHDYEEIIEQYVCPDQNKTTNETTTP